MPYYTIKDLAAELRISEKTIRREIKDGNIEIEKFRNTIRIASSAVDVYRERCKVKAKSQIISDTHSLSKHKRSFDLKPLIPPYKQSKTA